MSTAEKGGAYFREDTVCFCSSSNATALTVNNIVQELRGVDIATILGIPDDQLAELRSAHHSTDEQEAAVVRYWLLRDPLASWRRIIRQLDRWATQQKPVG